MKYNFIKTQSLWYIDIPEYIEAGGTYEDCQMVLGADSMLDLFSNGKNSVTLELFTEEVNDYDGILTKSDSILGSGSDYHVSFESKYRYDFSVSGYVWLCDVTKYVFGGEFPEKIWIKIPDKVIPIF